MAYKILNDDLTFANVNSENPKVCFLHGWGTSGKDFNKLSHILILLLLIYLDLESLGHLHKAFHQKATLSTLSN